MPFVPMVCLMGLDTLRENCMRKTAFSSRAEGRQPCMYQRSAGRAAALEVQSSYSSTLDTLLGGI